MLLVENRAQTMILRQTGRRKGMNSASAVSRAIRSIATRGHSCLEQRPNPTSACAIWMNAPPPQLAAGKNGRAQARCEKIGFICNRAEGTHAFIGWEFVPALL